MEIYEAAWENLPDIIAETFKDIKTFSKKKIKYYNTACGFDTESSSFMDAEGCPAACMYVWQLGLANKLIIIGRTWEQYESTMKMISDVLQLGDSKKLVIYVHNLAWDFAFLEHHHTWEQLFALEERSVCYAVDNAGFEFRCSYILTGTSLEYAADHLQHHQIRKMVGDLDYTLIRHSGTPLTSEELEYCIKDVEIIMAMIDERLEEDKITRIPLTKTGYTRRHMRSRCMTKISDGARGNGKWKKYRAIMEGLTIDVPVYHILNDGFLGGFTHANARYANRTQHDAAGMDINSDYPYQICTQLMPMSKFYQRMPENDAEFRKYLKLYACLFRVTVYCIDEKLTADHPISAYKCELPDDAIIDNGRLVASDWATFTCTELDWSIYEQFYDIKAYELEEFYIAYKGYLPKDFILGVLELYHDKSALKGIEGKEKEYENAKIMLNSCYGMMVENPVRDDISLDEEDGWIRTPANVEEKIDHYNKKMSRFTYYGWGIWITAYARRMLFDAIAELGSDYLYADTDSVKFLHPEKHLEWFNKKNEEISARCDAVSLALGIDRELFSPKTSSGKVKTLGQWDLDAPHMPLFKTLGAKRYLYTDDDGKLHLTCAGLDKEEACKYIEAESDPFEFFSSGMEIPPEYSGRKIHTYIDYEIQGDVTDYLGNVGHYFEKSAVNLRGSDYKLTLSAAYADYILGLVWKENPKI